MIIYKITNLINNKVYVGQTKQSLLARFRQHCGHHSNCRGLRGAIKKYGKQNFAMEVLFIADSVEALNQKEIEYINKFNSLVPNGYNLTTGGEGGYVRSEETRRLLSEANKGKSRPHTPESKAKLSASHSGDKNPMFGKKQSPETISKRSKALLGRKRSQEVRDKISAGHKRRNAPGAPMAPMPQ